MMISRINYLCSFKQFDVNKNKQYNSHSSRLNVDTYSPSFGSRMGNMFDKQVVAKILTSLDEKYSHIEYSPVAQTKNYIKDFLNENMSAPEFVQKYTDCVNDAKFFLANLTKEELDMNIKTFNNEFDLTNRIIKGIKSVEQTDNNLLKVLKTNITD